MIYEQFWHIENNLPIVYIYPNASSYDDTLFSFTLFSYLK